MKRTVTNVITYRMTRDEVIRALIGNVETQKGEVLFPDPAEVTGLDDYIEFIYKYAKESGEEHD